LLPELRAQGIEPIFLDKKGRWEIFGFLYRLVRAIRKERPDIVHTYLTGSNVLGALIKPLIGRCRLVWGIRDANTPLHRYDWMWRLFARLEALFAPAADLVISNSHAAATEAQARGFSARRIKVVFNGIDTDRFRPDANARTKIRAELGIREDEVALGMVARIDVKKDFETLFAAQAILRDRGRALTLFIVGSGDVSYEKKLRALAEKMEIGSSIVWLGSRSDVPELYNAFDIACLSSISEGFPNAVAEAMACGIACAVTDCGDSALIVGDPKLVAVQKDSEGLANALEYGIKSTYLAGARRDRIISQFSVSSLIGRSEAALKETL
jgi:glycosyltransferase involved in cell wall biosynthesis